MMVRVRAADMADRTALAPKPSLERRQQRRVRSSFRRLRAKPEKIIVDLLCGQPQFLEYALHGVADGVIVLVERPGILRAARGS